MPIRVRLTDEDLRRIQLRTRPAPIEGVVIAARRLVAQRACGRLELALADADRTRPAVEVLSPVGRPGFLGGYAESMDGAVEHLLAATRPELTGDLRQLAERGLRLPAWIMQLAAGDRQLRVQLARSLRYLYDSRVTDELAALAPVAELAQQRLVHRLADGGIDELFAGLRPHFRWIPPRTLAFETTDASVDFDFESPGRGLVLVPSPWLRSTPSLYLPAGDHSSRKVMVFYPAGPLLARTGVRSDLARVAELLGRTRSRILLCLAERPALSTHELATAVGISPASASEHAAVLRRNHLVVTTRVGHRTVHTISPIGIQLID